MTPPKMPAEVREEVLEILAAALVADLERHPEFYAPDPATDQPVAGVTDETPRDSTRSQPGSAARARRRRVKAGAEAAGQAP